MRSAIKSMDGGSGGGKSCGVFGIDASENLESSETKREGVSKLMDGGFACLFGKPCTDEH